MLFKVTSIMALDDMKRAGIDLEAPQGTQLQNSNSRQYLMLLFIQTINFS
jgi:hypothetical protein